MSQNNTVAPKTIVIGLGNPILADDGVGIYALQELQKSVAHPDVTFMECSLAGFNLLDLLQGYQKAIIIDSIKTGKGEIGEVYRLDIDSLFSTVRLASVHEINFATALELGRMMDLDMPSDIEIYVVEVEDNSTFREGCCAKVAAAIPVIKEAVIKSLEKIYGKV
ncbi:hydrogenase maturation protease [Calderihabitans maritimus]|uniref:Hydrogenase maturation protease n=1 Tax=Calderihabitans maritimus TaxID=1246530 RepID=A0A1Z5HP88_9FIRM|nr:hydrogenase maturation protease [Calderihabitans maritimus]GAW91115.1 hypothetical protein KKC1_02770 [Calderihabitans maritimus]